MTLTFLGLEVSKFRISYQQTSLPLSCLFDVSSSSESERNINNKQL